MQHYIIKLFNDGVKINKKAECLEELMDYYGFTWEDIEWAIRDGEVIK